jgi:hypothetical protein
MKREAAEKKLTNCEARQCKTSQDKAWDVYQKGARSMFGIMQKEMKGTISREESIKQIDRLLDRILKAREVKELSKCVNTKCSKELSNTWTLAKADACKRVDCKKNTDKYTVMQKAQWTNVIS